MSNNLTLNVGLRYEYSPWLSGYRGQVGTFIPGAAQPIVVGGEGNTPDLGAQFAGDAAYALFASQIQTASQAGLPQSITSTDRAQFGPRIGFAWQPIGDKTVFRGGYGLFYEQESSGDRVNNNMVPFRLDQTAFNDQAIPVRTMADFFLGTSLVNSAAPTIGAAALEQKMGRDHHFSLGVQQQIAPFTVARGELRRQHRTLPERHPQHQHPGTGGRRHPGAAAVPELRQHQLLRRLAGDHLPLAAGLARAADAQRPVLPGVLHLVEELQHAERHRRRRQHRPREGAVRLRRAAQHRDQRRLRAAGRPRAEASWPTPPAVIDGILGGWQIQGIYVWRSGRPFTPTISTDRANTGVGGQRPNRLGSGVLDNPTIDAWFDKTAFAIPAQFTYGDSGGGILREDSYKTLDFSLFKQFRIGSHRLVFRAEAFNLTNTPSFNAPNSAVDTAAGGRVTSTSSSPRQMQFALKYDF